tara:strand:- start:894 stop:2606 length:1713 start_codon:yes stop_codon:yes gene_type:complete
MVNIKNKNHNENNNVIILDFGDYDIQKKKKKKVKKKKRINNKKIAVDKVKETLLQFDNVLKDAKSQNINVPKELSDLPINIEDINTIEELNILNADLLNRIQAIRELLQKGALPIMPTLTGLPDIFRPSFETPQQIPQFPTFPKPQGLPPIIPARLPDPPDSNLDKVRKQLQQEQLLIINKLAEPQRSEALAEYKKRFGIPADRPLPATPTKPSDSPDVKIPDKLLETRKGFKIGKDTIPEFTAPKGWFEIWDRYRQYLEDVDFITRNNFIGNKSYHIPEADTNNLIATRDSLNQDRIQFNQNLSPDLKQSMLTNQFFSKVDKEEGDNLAMDVADLAVVLLRNDGIILNEITSGKTKPDVEKDLQKGKFKDPKLQQRKTLYEKELNDNIVILNNIISKLKSSKPSDNTEQDSIMMINELNAIQTKIKERHDGIDKVIQLAFLVEYQEVTELINEARELVPSTVKPREENPEPAPTPEDPEFVKKKKSVEILKYWISNIGTNYSSKVQDAVELLFGALFKNLVKQEKNIRRKRDMVKDRLAEESTMSPEAADPKVIVDVSREEFGNPLSRI